MTRQSFRAEQRAQPANFDVQSAQAVPRFGAQPATNLGLSGGPRLQAQQPLDFSGLQQVLQGWQRQAIETQREEMARAAAERGAEAQMERGVGGVAETPEGFRPIEQRAFEAQAQEVYNQQVRTDALRTAAELQLQNRGNPGAFETAWQGYREKTVDTVAQSNATLAAEVDAYLDSVGGRGAIALMEQEHKDSLERQTADMLASLDEAADGAANTVLNTPTAQVREEQIGDLTSQIKELADQGLIRGADAAKFVRETEERIGTNYVLGRAQQAFSDNDFDEVQLLVDELRTGIHFSDNQKGLRLADQFERQAGALRDQQNSVVLAGDQQAVDGMQAALRSALERGGDTTGLAEQVDEFYNRARNSIDPDIRTEAAEVFKGFHYVREYQETLDSMGMPAFNEFERYLTSPEAENLPNNARNFLLDAVRDSEARIGDAVAPGGDVAAAGRGSVVNETWHGATAEQRVESAELAARRTGNSLAATAFYTRDQLQDAASAMNSAVRSGDPSRLDEVYKQFIGPYQLTGSTAVAARHIGTVNEEIGGMLLVASNFDQRQLFEFMNSATQGANVSRGPTLRVGDLDNDSLTAIDALSEDNGGMRTMIASALENYARGQIVVNDLAEGDELESAVNELLSNIEVAEFSSGVVVPRRELGDGPREAEASIAAIEEVLGSPDFVRLFDDGGIMRPVPVGPGEFAFRNRQTGGLVRDPNDENGEPLVARVGTDVLESVIEEDIAQIQAKQEEEARNAELRMVNALNLAEQDRNQILGAGTQLGLNEDDVDGFFRALSLSPARNRYRLLSGGIAPEVLDSPREFAGTRAGEELAGIVSAFTDNQNPYMTQARAIVSQLTELPSGDALVADQQAVTEAAEAIDARFGSFTNQDIGRIGTLILFSEHMETYNGDRAKALAAIAAGANEVDEAVEIGGEEWFSLLDEETQSFVAKGTRSNG